MALQNEMKEHLAKLISKADNETKEVLSKYNPNMSFKQMIASMKSMSVEKLLYAAEYLLVENAETLYKDDLIESLLQRIENLLPTICLKCSVTYTVAISDIPKIVCAVCGQGAHDECIEELDLTKIDFGYSLVCTRCIPSPKEKKKKSTTKDKAQTEKSKTLKHDETDTDSAKKEENKDNDSINAEYLDASDNIDPHQDKDEYKTDRGNGNIKNNILQNHSHQNNTKK